MEYTHTDGPIHSRAGCGSLLHPFTNLFHHQENGPHVITRGDGVWIYDEDGKGYIEAAAGLFCASLGFSEERLAEAAYRQMKTLPFMHLFTRAAIRQRSSFPSDC